MSTVLLVRHGESTWNRQGRVQGWAATRLTDRGRDQAQTLAAHLDSRYAVDRVIASDLLRAQETAREIAGAVGVEPSFRADWRERDFGNLQGMYSEDMLELHPQHSLDDVGYAAAEERPVGGESLLDTRERVLRGWSDLCGLLARDETAVVVTHTGPIYLLLGHLAGDTIVEAMLDRELHNCSINEIRVDGNGAATDRGDVRMICQNETDFLDGQSEATPVDGSD